MLKYSLKIIAILSLALLLLGACRSASDEPVSPDQATTSDRAVEPGDCIVKPPKEPFACTMQYDPVCGCDGKTYSNACSARGAGVPRSTPGACDEQTTD